MVLRIKKMGAVIKALRDYIAEERREEKKIREQGIRRYIEDYRRPLVVASSAMRRATRVCGV